jgi:hypothetical protein
MSGSIEQILGRELRSTETLLWAGVPRQNIFLRSNDVFLIPFSLAWFGFVIFAGMQAISKNNGPPSSLIVLIPLGLMGLYLVLGRFLVDAWHRERMVYAVTSERIIAVYGLLKRIVLERSIDSLTDVTLVQGSGNGGTIGFGRDATKRFAGWDGLPGFGEPTLHCFYLDGNVQEVYDIICKARESARQ